MKVWYMEQWYGSVPECVISLHVLKKIRGSVISGILRAPCIVKGLWNDRLEDPLGFYNLRSLVGVASQEHGDVFVWMLAPHIPMGFPLSSARMEEMQDGEKGRKTREILVSVALDSFNSHRPVLVTVPI